MKKINKTLRNALYLVLAVGFMASCNNPRVTQKIEKCPVYKSTILNTQVWHNTDIVWAKYDYLSDIDSNLVVYRQMQADSVVMLIKACR